MFKKTAILFLLSFFAISWASVSGLHAEEKKQNSTVEIPKTLQKDQVEDFIAPLSDKEIRQILLEALKKQAVESNDQTQQSNLTSDPLIEKLRKTLILFGERYDKMIGALHAAPQDLERVFLNLTDLQGFPKLLYGLGVFFVLIAIGYVASWLLIAPLLFYHKQSQPEKFVKISNRLLYYFIQFILGLLKIVIFAALTFGISLFFFDRFDPMRLFVTTYFIVILIVWFVHLIFQFISKMMDQKEKIISYRNPIYVDTIFTSFLISFFLLSSGLLIILGLTRELVILFNISAGFVSILLLSVAFLRNQKPILEAYIGVEIVEKTKVFFDKRRFVMNVFPPIMIIFLLVLWIVWAGNLFLERSTQAYYAFFSLLFVVLIPTINKAIEFCYLSNFKEKHKNAVVLTHSLQLFISWLLTLLFLSCFIEALGIPFISLLFTDYGFIFFKAIISILLTIAIAYGLWILTKSSIEAYLEREKKKQAELGVEGQMTVREDGEPVIIKTRAETLLPLLRFTILILLVSISTMVILASIGIDIGPLLAGAGVVGLAIGFGAQALVKDIVSGIFFLIDDAFRVGEYVEMDDIRGEVEKISLRSMQLRHHRGAVHTIPFGELKWITNHNRDWNIYKQDFRVPFEADLDKIRKIVKKIGKELMKDEELGPKFIQPLKSQGVKRMDDSAMILGTKFMCKPREQFYLRRVIFQRIQEAFAKEGIDFATRQVKVELEETDHEHNTKIAGAAAVENDANKPKDDPKKK